MMEKVRLFSINVEKLDSKTKLSQKSITISPELINDSFNQNEKINSFSNTPANPTIQSKITPKNKFIPDKKIIPNSIRGKNFIRLEVLKEEKVLNEVKQAIKEAFEKKVNEVKEKMKPNDEQLKEDLEIDEFINSHQKSTQITNKKSNIYLKFKSVSYMLILFYKIKRKIREKNKETKLISLKKFVHYISTDNIEDRMSKWMFECIKIPFISILKSQDLDLDCHQWDKNLDKVEASKIIEDKYIKFEVFLLIKIKDEI